MVTHYLRQRHAAHIAGYDIWRIGPQIGVDDFSNTRAADTSHRRHFALEPRAPVRASDDRWPKRLNGYQAAICTNSQIDDSHAAFPDALEYAVRADVRIHETTVAQPAAAERLSVSSRTRRGAAGQSGGARLAGLG